MKTRILLFVFILIIIVFYAAYVFTFNKFSPMYMYDLARLPKAGSLEQSNTITQLPKPGNATSVVMDFSSCSPGGDVVYFAFGSMHFKFEGIKQNNCVFYYGGEVENPNWDRTLPYKCSVPASLGKKTYTVTTMGISMDELDSYCEKI